MVSAILEHAADLQQRLQLAQEGNRRNVDMAQQLLRHLNSTRVELKAQARKNAQLEVGLAAASRCSDDDGDDDAAPTDADTFATAALWVLGGVVLLTTLFGGFCIVRAARRREERRQFSAEEACRAGVYWAPRGDDEALRIAR